MLRWCSYCQKFIGEVPPFHNLGVSHGMCADCEPKAASFGGADLALARSLGAIQNRFINAGKRGDLDEVPSIVEAATAANIRAVDMLIGILTPALHQIGEDWKHNVINVATQHRFTTFCRKAFDLVAAKVHRAPSGPEPPRADRSEILLVNAPGNDHTLGIQTLALWLTDKGLPVRLVDEALGLGELVALVEQSRPSRLLISMALAEQSDGVAAIADLIAQLPARVRPRVIVGGSAVKMNLVTAIPGTELMTDISQL